MDSTASRDVETVPDAVKTYSPSPVRYVATGRIETGIIKTGEEVQIIGLMVLKAGSQWYRCGNVRRSSTKVRP